MLNHKKYTELIQWHNAIEFFNYNPAVDWAIELIRNGNETENVLILASFSPPVDSYEIKPYVSGAIIDLGLEEKYGDYSIIANAHYHLELIIEDYETRLNLKELYKLCMNTNHEFGLSTFYNLYHAWSDLEEVGYNFYYEGATLSNINKVLKKEARIWIEQYVHGMNVEEDGIENDVDDGKRIEVEAVKNNIELEESNNKHLKRNSIWQMVKSLFAKKINDP